MTEERVHFTYHFRKPFITEAIRAGIQQSRNLEAGADAEAVEECCLVSYESFYTSQLELENMGNVLHIFVRYFCFYILFYKFPFTKQEHLMGYDTIYNSDSQKNKIKSVC